MITITQVFQLSTIFTVKYVNNIYISSLHLVVEKAGSKAREKKYLTIYLQSYFALFFISSFLFLFSSPPSPSPPRTLPLPFLPFSSSSSSPPFSFFFKSSFQRPHHPYFSEGRKVICTYAEATATQRLSCCCCFSLVDNEVFWALGKDMFLTHPLNYLRQPRLSVRYLKISPN